MGVLAPLQGGPAQRERAVSSLGEVIDEGSNVFLNGTILGVQGYNPLNCHWRGPPQIFSFPHTQGVCVEGQQGDLSCGVKG